MKCLNPILAHNRKDGNGIIFGSITDNVRVREEAKLNEFFFMPCGKCINCLMSRSRMWSVRIMHEASMWPKNVFITLTFNDKHLNKNRSLKKDDFQKFMKRLRRYSEYHLISDNIRYYHCGEYGIINKRPHHHAILFNFDFPDKVPWKKYSSNVLYRSPMLEKLWPYGFSSIGTVTYESAAYVARYIMKKAYNGHSKEEVGKLPEYTTMSRNPGIGNGWLMKYYTDVYNHDRLIIKDDVIIRPPRYYDTLYSGINPLHYEKIKNNRKNKAIESQSDVPLPEKYIMDYAYYLGLATEEQINEYKKEREEYEIRNEQLKELAFRRNNQLIRMLEE